jgi:hypothetical protein
MPSIAARLVTYVDLTAGTELMICASEQAELLVADAVAVE